MMNERIKELKAQCYISIIDRDDDNEYDMEKFAELIIRDVLKIVKNNTPKPDPYGERARYDAQEYGECVANDIRDNIKYLFGVEE